MPSPTKKGYQRVLLKLSGEALSESGQSGISGRTLKALGEDIAAVAKTGIEIAVVIGGGNIWRYRDHAKLPIERSASDQMGMLASVMNSVALQNAIESAGVYCRVQSALTMPEVAESYIRRRAVRHLEKGRVVLFAAGVGQPYFTTDTAGALRALEISADVLLKGSNVDGVYDSDPDENPKAKRFDHITHSEVLTRNLRVMDATAISLCRENKLPIVVFDVLAKGALKKAVSGNKIGTVVK